MNIFGNKFQLSLIGSSHGKLVGVLIDGIPPAIEINIEEINNELKKRRPGQSEVTTDRSETDQLIIETGLINGKTTGEPILAYVRNKDIDSSYYDTIKFTPRPGHADYPAYIKYQGASDHRGGGRFSGRMTIGLVIAGSIAKQILKSINIEFIAYSKEIGGITGNPDNYQLNEDFLYSKSNIVRVADPELIESCISKIKEVKEKGNSIGGIIECIINGLPVGVGEPWFNSIESLISHMMFAIPAVKGVEFGSGFKSARMTGRIHNDEFYIDEEGKINTKTNNAGGILGGLSSGMPVIFRVAIKPTSSISQQQMTVDLVHQKETSLVVAGRHDPCIVPRAVPVVSNATACVILDLMLIGGFIHGAENR